MRPRWRIALAAALIVPLGLLTRSGLPLRRVQAMAVAAFAAGYGVERVEDTPGGERWEVYTVLADSSTFSGDTAALAGLIAAVVAGIAGYALFVATAGSVLNAEVWTVLLQSVTGPHLVYILTTTIVTATLNGRVIPVDSYDKGRSRLPLRGLLANNELRIVADCAYQHTGVGRIDQLVGRRVVGRRGAERLHVGAVTGLGHREAAQQFQVDDLLDVGVVVPLGAQVLDGAAEKAPLHTGLDQQ